MYYNHTLVEQVRLHSLTTIKIKNILKYSLHEAQNTYGDNWCEYNFTKFAKID